MSLKLTSNGNMQEKQTVVSAETSQSTVKRNSGKCYRKVGRVVKQKGSTFI
jgi:hypothetical protein